MIRPTKTQIEDAARIVAPVFIIFNGLALGVGIAIGYLTWGM